MLYRSWTQAEVAELKRLRKEGYQGEDIARMLNRTERSIHNKVTALRAQASVLKEKPPATTRKCLKCHNTFKSSGSGHRLCKNCTASNSNTTHFEYVLSV